MIEDRRLHVTLSSVIDPRQSASSAVNCLCRTLDIPDLAATEAFGRRLGELLFPGAVVALSASSGRARRT